MALAYEPSDGEARPALSDEAVERALRAAAIREGLGYRAEAAAIRQFVADQRPLTNADMLLVAARLTESFPGLPYSEAVAVAECAIGALNERRVAK